MNKKSVLALILAGMMTVSTAVPAFADTTLTPPSQQSTEAAPQEDTESNVPEENEAAPQEDVVQPLQTSPAPTTPTVVENGTVTKEQAVAKIGDTYYATLSDAVEAAKDQSGTTTITLTDNASGCGIIVPEKSNIVFDFAGFTYTIDESPLAGSTGTKSQCFQLLKGSKITMRNGAIVADNLGVKMMVQNYSDLTLENMTLDATKGNNGVGYVLSNNNGEVHINSTHIIAKPTGTAFDVCSSTYPTYPSVSVTVENSKIDGPIEYTGKNDGKQTSELIMKNTTVNGGIIKESEYDISKNTIENSTIKADPTLLFPITDPTTPVAKAGENYAVGNIAISNLAAANSAIEITRGDVNLTNLPAGTKITNSGTGTVTANGVVIGKDQPYTIPAASVVVPTVPFTPNYSFVDDVVTETAETVAVPSVNKSSKVMVNGKSLDSKGTVSVSKLKKEAKKNSKDTAVEFETIKDKKAEAKLFIQKKDISKVKDTILTRIFVNPRYVYNKNAVKKFEKQFPQADLKAVTFAQKGDFPVEVTASIKMTKKELSQYQDGYVYLYNYNPKTNTYKYMGKVEAKLDKEGFLKFTTTRGNVMLLSDRPLKK